MEEKKAPAAKKAKPAAKVDEPHKLIEVRAATPAWFFIGIAALFSVASAFAAVQIVAASSKTNSAPIVMIDSAGLVLAKSKSLFLTKGGQQNPEEAAKKFIGELDAIINEYTKAGIIVINSAAALNRPVGTDITSEVAAKMGVNLDVNYPATIQ